MVTHIDDNAEMTEKAEMAAKTAKARRRPTGRSKQGRPDPKPNSEAATPRYAQIRDVLAAELHEGRFKAGRTIPSERDIASRFGVSIITVRLALAALQRQGLIYRVPRLGTFAGPRPSGGPLRRHGKTCLALLVPMLRTGVGPLILAGAEDACLEHGIHLEVYHANNDPRTEARQLERLITAEVDGAIIFAYSSDVAERVLRLKVAGLPLVVVDHRIPGVQADFVSADNRQGGQRAAEHLAALKLKHHVFVTIDTTTSSNRDRLEGFTSGLKAAGQPDPLLITYPGGDGWSPRRNIRDACLPAFKTLPTPIGVFCHNDYAAVGVYQAAFDLGWRIGRDIFILGFDDDPIAQAMTPELSTIRQPAEEIGAAAAALLLERLAGKTPADHAQTQTLPVELIPRASTHREIDQ